MGDGSGNGILNYIVSHLRKRLHCQNGSDLADEISDLMDEGREKGLITGEESDMVHGVLELKETTAHSIMIPRTLISSAPINSTLGEFINLITECGHTRIPIYEENIDHIVGILHAKDLLKLHGEDLGINIPLSILRKPYFVLQNKKVSEILRDMKAMKTHLAIITDEYGGIAGIITIEDIVEEIIGEIEDEHDTDLPLISVVNKHEVLVDSRLDIEKLTDQFDMEKPEGEFESVGGFIINILGRIPKKGEQIFFNGLKMTIKSADERKIDKIQVSYQPNSTPETKNKEEH